MWNVKAKVIPVITGAIGTISKSDNTWVKYRESMKLDNYQKKKKKAVSGTTNANVKYKTYFMCEITLHVAQTVSTGQLQNYMP